ncbi:MAG: very short patch repair endonuclease [Planctomycetota bacterium]|nr:very short patch repair endonuclease [Planctomycetota bacterium]
MDSVSPEVRSRIMGSVRSKDTLPEMRVRRIFHALGLRFRLHRSELPGSPDLTLRKWRTVVFVHGCFWHRHRGCPNTRTPKSRVDFWEGKFRQNVIRDQRNRRDLRRAGWKVIVVWECEVSNERRLIRKIQKAFEGSNAVS